MKQWLMNNDNEVHNAYDYHEIYNVHDVHEDHENFCIKLMIRYLNNMTFIRRVQHYVPLQYDTTNSQYGYCINCKAINKN